MKASRIFLTAIMIFILANISFAQIKVDASGNVGVGGEPSTYKMNLGGSMGANNTIFSTMASGDLFKSTNSGVQDFRLTNDNILGINTLQINDPGAGEGIGWQGGVNISLYQTASGGYNGLTFKTSSTYPFVFTGNKVGINTTAPTYGSLQINGEGVNEGVCLLGVGSSLRFYVSNNVGFVTRAGNNTLGLAIDNYGNVGINNASPTYKLDVEGIIRASNVTVPSDKRYKTDIFSMTSDLEKIKKLNPVNYKMKSQKLSGETSNMVSSGIMERHVKIKETIKVTSSEGIEYDSIVTYTEEVNLETEKKADLKKTEDRNHMGFVAQEIQEIYPEIVYEDKDGYLSVDYISLIPVLVSAVKEQQEQIESQQKEIEELKRMVGN